MLKAAQKWCQWGSVGCKHWSGLDVCAKFGFDHTPLLDLNRDLYQSSFFTDGEGLTSWNHTRWNQTDAHPSWLGSVPSDPQDSGDPDAREVCFAGIRNVVHQGFAPCRGFVIVD